MVSPETNSPKPNNQPPNPTDAYLDAVLEVADPQGAANAAAVEQSQAALEMPETHQKSTLTQRIDRLNSKVDPLVLTYVVDASKVALDGYISWSLKRKEQRSEKRQRKHETKQQHKEAFNHYIGLVALSGVDQVNPKTIERVRPAGFREKRKERKIYKHVRKHEKNTRRAVSRRRVFGQHGGFKKRIIGSKVGSLKASYEARKDPRKAGKKHKKVIITKPDPRVRKSTNKMARSEKGLLKKAVKSTISPPAAEINPTPQPEVNSTLPSEFELERYQKAIIPMAILGLRKKIDKETKEEIILQVNRLRHRNAIENLGLYEDQIAQQAKVLAGPIVKKRLLDRHLGITGNEFDTKLPADVRDRANELMAMPIEDLELLIHPTKAPVVPIQRQSSQEARLNRRKIEALMDERNLSVIYDEVQQYIKAAIQAEKATQGIDILSDETLRAIESDAKSTVVSQKLGNVRMTLAENAAFEHAFSEIGRLAAGTI